MPNCEIIFGDLSKNNLNLKFLKHMIWTYHVGRMKKQTISLNKTNNKRTEKERKVHPKMQM